MTVELLTAKIKKGMPIFLGLVVFQNLAIADEVQTFSPIELPTLDEVVPPAAQERIDSKRTPRGAVSVQSIPADAPKLIDLRSRDTAIKTQKGPYCSAYATVAVIENLLGGQINLSEPHAWSKYRVYSSEAAVKAMTRSGVVENEWWPEGYSRPFAGYLDQWWYKITENEYLEDDLGKVVDALAHGHPVVSGFSTPYDMYYGRHEQVDPNSGPLKNSGHATAVVGYKLDDKIPGGGALLMKNSWGTSTGDHGYQWYPFNLCQKANMYCVFWSVKGVTQY